MTIQHLARSNYDLLQKDYSKVTKQVLSKNITFTYPKFDEYIDVNKTAEGFKRIFPNAKFNKYNSKEHMPRGNFLNDENLMYTFHQIVTAIQ